MSQEQDMSPANSRARILVVDDEPAVLRVCRRLLERDGHQVHTIEDPQRALVWLEGNDPVDLLVCDVYMPKMQGDELVELIQQRWPDIAVVFISGHLLDSHAERRLQLGGRIVFLEKPFLADDLSEAITSALTAAAAAQTNTSGEIT